MSGSMLTTRCRVALVPGGGFSLMSSWWDSGVAQHNSSSLTSGENQIDGCYFNSMENFRSKPN